MRLELPEITGGPEPSAVRLLESKRMPKIAALGRSAKDRAMPLRRIGRFKISSHTRLSGDFIESALHVQLFAHLTTPRRISEVTLCGVFDAWIRNMQARYRVTLGWVRAIERRPNPHIHAAVLAATPLDCTLAADLWQAMVAPRYSEAAKIEPYRAGLCGMGYILKTLDTDAEEIQFSENAAAFTRTASKSIFKASASQLRQQRRIREQLVRAAGTGNATSGSGPSAITAKPQAAK